MSDGAIIRLSGCLHLDADELPKGTEIHITVADTASGEALANGYGRIVSVTDKDVLDKQGDVETVLHILGIKVS